MTIINKEKRESMTSPIMAIERVLDKRQKRGATDEQLIKYLEHLKTVWKGNNMHNALDGFIDAIRQTPLTQ